MCLCSDLKPIAAHFRCSMAMALLGRTVTLEPAQGQVFIRDDYILKSNIYSLNSPREL